MLLVRRCGFDRQSGLDPALLALRILPHIRVSQRRQFTGGVLGSMSSRTGAVDDDIRVQVRQNLVSAFCHLAGRQIDRSRQMTQVIGFRGQRFDQNEIVATIDLGLELVARDRHVLLDAIRV